MKFYIDALATRMVTHPQTLDVIVASNLFGDLLSDIGSGIAGRGIASPIGAIWAGAMILDHLGEPAPHDAIVELVISGEAVRTPDLGGTATTKDMTTAVAAALGARARPAPQG